MEVLDPVVAVALRQLGALEDRNLPMLAAHWVAQGRGGDVLVELAGLHGTEREIGDLWPTALSEVGVATPVGHDRLVALPWVAAQVAAGRRELRWLVTVLWPPVRFDTGRRGNPADREEELLDAVVYALEDVLEFAARVAGDAAARSPWWRRHGQAEQAGVRKARLQVERVVAALTRGDVAAAAAAVGVVPR